MPVDDALPSLLAFSVYGPNGSNTRFIVGTAEGSKTLIQITDGRIIDMPQSRFAPGWTPGFDQSVPDLNDPEPDQAAIIRILYGSDCYELFPQNPLYHKLECGHTVKTPRITGCGINCEGNTSLEDPFCCPACIEQYIEYPNEKVSHSTCWQPVDARERHKHQREQKEQEKRASEMLRMELLVFGRTCEVVPSRTGTREDRNLAGLAQAVGRMILHEADEVEKVGKQGGRERSRSPEREWRPKDSKPRTAARSQSRAGRKSASSSEPLRKYRERSHSPPRVRHSKSDKEELHRAAYPKSGNKAVKKVDEEDLLKAAAKLQVASSSESRGRLERESSVFSNPAIIALALRGLTIGEKPSTVALEKSEKRSKMDAIDEAIETAGVNGSERTPKLNDVAEEATQEVEHK
ncbi:hypothetical protein B0A49_00663 [Cryomyces minteri]|uniref:Uncharacterized protein n=1 Tax=Cryomyces minteri TaxID=331657 RepID=A0A4U0Y0C1_9PEZI|nr:hypothetical protein B0A49_00663 [Cryomyces minteri]